MKSGIHPEYVASKIICACGRVWETMSTKPEIHVETCSACHPYFTGNQKGTRHFGRAEQFYNKYGAITLDDTSNNSSVPTNKVNETTEEAPAEKQ